ncbi:hypothetical protein [Planktothrix sp. FACHB-1355]|uniref:hypothetical protein n=1 Tax=Planktothrix sp. FACHB-1355 TaxID=2692854 RepID=UPI00168ABE93|nr:hypothetical protein [Planktothrix sp. FACHB-1355]
MRSPQGKTHKIALTKQLRSIERWRISKIISATSLLSLPFLPQTAIEPKRSQAVAFTVQVYYNIRVRSSSPVSLEMAH